MKQVGLKIELTKGYIISRILKGGWQLSGGHGEIDKKMAIDDMFSFTKKGITTFDCADIYTGVEEMIGEFLKQYKKKYGTDAEKIHVHTKYVPDLATLSSMTKRDVRIVIERSLERLGLNTLHLVQFHWWDYDIPRYVEIAGYLKELQIEGKIQNIGLTNFNTKRLREIIEGGIPIVSHQVQYSVLDRRVEKKMIPFCKNNNIQLLCYGTAAGGFLSERYLGEVEPQAPLENRSLTKYKLIIDDFGGWELFQELLKVLQGIAQKHSVSITNVASKYILDKPQVAGIIIGARNKVHLKDNMCVFDFELDKQDEKMIKKIQEQAIDLKGDFYDLERKKSGKHASIMKYNLNKV